MPAPGGHSGQGVPDLAQQHRKDLPLSRRQRREQRSFHGLHALRNMADFFSQNAALLQLPIRQSS